MISAIDAPHIKRKKARLASATPPARRDAAANAAYMASRLSCPLRSTRRTNCGEHAPPHRLLGTAAPRCSSPGAYAAARGKAASLRRRKGERDCCGSPSCAELTPAWRARRRPAWPARRANGGRGPSRGLRTHRGAAWRRTTCGARVARHDATTDRPMDAGQIPSDVRRVRGGCAPTQQPRGKNVGTFPHSPYSHPPPNLREYFLTSVLLQWCLV